LTQTHLLGILSEQTTIMEISLEKNDLLNIINLRLGRDELVLPTLPDIAFEINAKLIDEKAEIADVVQLIKKDPAIAANVIKFANTVLIKGTVPIKTIEQAAIRIGFKSLRNIILSFAIQQIFFAKNVAFAVDHFTAWKQSSDAAIISCTLLDYLQKREMAIDLDQDVMFLISLVHNIGYLPVLTEADRLGREVSTEFFNKDFINNVFISTGLRLTKRILSEWNFNEEVITPAYRWPEESYTSDNISYLDVLRLSLTKTDSVCSELKSIFYNEALKKGMIENESWINEKECKEGLAKYRKIFYN
jgi:HD-like signal output (HDOD) protein